MPRLALTGATLAVLIVSSVTHSRFLPLLTVWGGLFVEHTPSLTRPAGFASRTAQAPATGTWDVTGTVTSSVGYGNETIGTTLSRVWTITRSCAATCSYTLIRPVVSGEGLASVVRAPLVHGSDGWRVTWPGMPSVCRSTPTGTVEWQTRELWVIRFTDGGATALAREHSFSSTPACGYGEATVVWRATLASSLTATNAGAPSSPPDSSQTATTPAPTV